MGRIVPLFAVLALVLVACDSEGGATTTSTPVIDATTTGTPLGTPRLTDLNTPTATKTPTPEPTPQAEPVGHPPGTTTGIEDVDRVIRAVVDGGSVPPELWRYREEPCVATPVNDYGPPPVCPEGVEAGTPVELIPSVGCHGGYATPEHVGEMFDPGPRVERRIFGVARPDSPLDPRAEYSIVVSMVAQSGQEWGMTYEVGGGGIVALNGGCLWSPEYMWESTAGGQVLLAPPADAFYGYTHETPVGGSEVVQRVAQAVMLGQPGELRRLLSPGEAACFSHIRISAQPVDCAGSAPADPSEPAFVVTGCHFGVRTTQEFERELYGALNHRPRLYGVRGIADWPDHRASVVLVFARPRQDVTPSFAVLVNDDGIVGFDGSCGEDAASLWTRYDQFAVGSAVLPPWTP